MGGEAASPTNPKKVRAGKRKTKYIDCLKDLSTQDHKLCERIDPDEPTTRFVK